MGIPMRGYTHEYAHGSTHTFAYRNTHRCTDGYTMGIPSGLWVLVGIPSGLWVFLAVLLRLGLAWLGLAWLGPVATLSSNPQ